LLGNLSVFLIFGGMIGAGIMRGVKEVREFRKGTAEAKPTSPGSMEAQVAAVTILENATLSAWTRSNKEVRDGLDRLVECVSDLRDELRDTRRETAELRHVIQDAEHDRSRNRP
jgi:hypothetical protein